MIDDRDNGRVKDDVLRADGESGWALGLFLRVAERGVRRPDERKATTPAEPLATTLTHGEAKLAGDNSSCDSDLWVG